MKDLLNVLYDHYIAQQSLGNVPPFGWTHEEANYAVELNDEGKITGIYGLGATYDAGNEKEKKKGKSSTSQNFVVPVCYPRSSGCYPYPFCDYAYYMFGTKKTDKNGTDVSGKYYGSMKDAVLGLREYLGESPALCAVYKFYETWDNAKTEENPCIVSSDIAKGGKCMFFYNGKPIFEDEVFKKSYEKLVETYGKLPIPQRDKNGKLNMPPKPTHIRSMVSGEVGLKADYFCNVKIGTKVVSVLSNNKENTNYFGRKNGDAIPISQQDGHKIVEAINELLRRGYLVVPANKSSSLDSVILVWCDDAAKEEESFIVSLLLDSSAKQITSANESGSETAERVLHDIQARKGRMSFLSEKEKNVNVNVWVIGTRKHGSIVSDFTQVTLGEICEHFQRHYDNMEIVRSPMCKQNDGTTRDFARPNTVYRSLFAKDEDGKVKVNNPVLWKEISRSVFLGKAYPPCILDMALNRVKRESTSTVNNSISATTAGIIKAYLINNERKDDLTVALNESNLNPAYLTGRIFAHMESAQKIIDPNNQTTFKNRYFERVMTNPSAAIPQMHVSFNLLRAKAGDDDRKRAIFTMKEKEISALIDMLDGNYPDKLSSTQQSYFVVGYYQQVNENIRRATEIAQKNAND